jgi:hypothetical protein
MSTFEPGIDTLVGDLIQASHAQTLDATNRVIENERRRANEAEAAIRLVRHRILRALHGPYMPSSFVLEGALYPGMDAIEQEINETKGTQ